MLLTITDIDEFDCGFEALSAAGNEAPVEGLNWSVSDPDVLALTVAADGKTAVVSTTGKLGTAQLRLAADARIGEGENPLLGILDVEVVASEAVNVKLVPGAARPKAG